MQPKLQVPEQLGTSTLFRQQTTSHLLSIPHHPTRGEKEQRDKTHRLPLLRSQQLHKPILLLLQSINERQQRLLPLFPSHFRPFLERCTGSSDGCVEILFAGDGDVGECGEVGGVDAVAGGLGREEGAVDAMGEGGEVEGGGGRVGGGHFCGWEFQWMGIGGRWMRK